MPQITQSIDKFMQTFDRDAIREDMRQAEDERQKLVDKFPLSEWSELPLERYAYGLKNPQETFSWALENGTKKLALLANHGAQGFKIYFRKKENQWWYEGDFKSAEDAWFSIREIYVHAFARAKGSRWTQIDDLHTSRHGTNALLKALICYFPDDLLPITSASHLSHFLVQFGVVDFDRSTLNIVNLNRLLLLKLKKTWLFEDWKTFEIAQLLYAWAPPTRDSDGDVEDDDEESAEIEAANESWSAEDNRLYEKIVATLTHKQQVILCGPPGTGKTYTAENFAKRWLRRSVEKAVSSQGNLDEDGVGERANWIVVSNYQNHAWDSLFDKGTEIFKGGKLKGNFKAARKGDLVFGYTGAPKQKIEAIARVSREMFVDEDNVHCIELAPVARVKHGISFDDFLKSAVLKKSECVQSNMRGTLFKLTEKEADALVKLSIKREAALVDVFKANAGDSAQGDKLIRLTFHPTYSYEDFIEGFRPDPTVSNNLVLKLKDGIFKKICREAEANKELRYLILIDEINRANIAKVFGEVITIIEKDKRNLSVQLPQSNEQFCVPPNVYIIGTMNTSDRSIKLFDIALRRRFSFIAMQPEAQLLAGAKIGPLDLGGLLEHLNSKLVAAGNRDKQIGHAFFMENGKAITDLSCFARVMRQDVLPLLQEYCFDRFADLANFIGAELVDVQRDCLRDERLEDDDKLVAALAKVIASKQHVS